ncbi:MAG: glycosyltransferase [Rhodobacteraceae bacterium]|nr:glycosyltransferase [Paracoccaceae bacterium]
MTKATLLIPAHNEEALIGRTLWYLTKGLPMHDFEVIVIANGCTDATASRARSALPQAKVIETDQPGKCNALNLGYAASDKCTPTICLDADLDVTSESLMALVAPLAEGQAQAACGKMDVATPHASPAVRTFYKGWKANPYFNRGKFGGLFALSAEAAERLFPLPEITADDEFIRRSFADDQKLFVPACSFVARAPARLSDLVKVRRRSLRGARQVSGMGLPSPERGSAFAMLKQAVLMPSEAISISFFLMVMTWVRLSLMFEGEAAKTRWERDLSSRALG